MITPQEVSSMNDEHTETLDSSRRDFLRHAGLVAATVAVGGGSDAFAQSNQSPATKPQSGSPSKPYNIVFILSDQERFFRPGELPLGYRLPGHERLLQRGVSFINHRINSCVCTSSRSVLYTGRHIQQTRMFDNTNFPWITSMSTEIPTLGDMLRDAGYYTAYKGKWHLTREFETVNKLGSPTKIFTEEMEAYGFSDYLGVGDIIAHDRGGYLHDALIAGMGASWLRGRGRDLADAGKPWFLAVNLVNPHDIMFYDTDAPGSPVKPPPGLTTLKRDPIDPLYAKKWKFQLPTSHTQPLDAPGRPLAHREFLRSHDVVVGPIDPNEPSRWVRRHNYYLNCLRDFDRNLVAILDQLDASGLADSTIVVLTSDHGDLDGAHNLHSKGTVPYREQNNVPLIVAHPSYAKGKQCKALTTHLDIAPTLLAFTGITPQQRGTILKDLPGKDFSGLLKAPDKAGVNAVRDGALFNFNMLASIDADFLQKAVAHTRQGGNPKDLASAGIRPDMMKRGAVRSIFDGRYVFTRYFSPKQHNRPTTFEALYGLNDVELFDTVVDPNEMTNLASAGGQQRELVLAMNDKLNRIIEAEVGEDPGEMLPGGVDGGWEVTAETMAGF